MKKTRFLMPMLGLATLSSVVAPLVSCRRKDNSDIAKINKECSSIYGDTPVNVAMVSSPRTYKKNDVVKFSFNWSDRSKLYEWFQWEDREEGWYISLGAWDDDEDWTFDTNAYFSEEPSDCHIYLDGQEVEGTKYAFSDYGEAMTPTEAWDLKDTSVISGSLKIVDIQDAQQQSINSFNMQFMIFTD